MSQNIRSESSDSKGNSGRGSNESQDRKSYEGFEGMNYEQKRQPYNPRPIGNTSGNDSNGTRERRDEL
jgi:hypothetical protein